VSTTALAVTSLVVLVVAEGGARSRPASGTWWGPPAPDALPRVGAAATVHHGSTRRLRGAAGVAFLGAVVTELVAPARQPLVGWVAWTAVAALLALALRDGLAALREASVRVPAGRRPDPRHRETRRPAPVDQLRPLRPARHPRRTSPFPPDPEERR
jgi:hypothetical protein